MEDVSVLTGKGSISRNKAIESLRKLPAMSAAAARLLRRLSRRDCDLVKVAELIETDPVLSGQVVQSANSAAFNRAEKIESVRHAIVMVGVGTVRRFALVRTVSNLFSRRNPAPSFSMTRFNLHSVAVGTMVELLAEEVPLEDPEAAFLAGLFHDLGTPLIAVAMPEQYEDLLAVHAVSGESMVACEESLLETTHAELSALALEAWGMPECIRNAAAFHHSPQLTPGKTAPAPVDASRNCVPLSLAVHQADALADALGMSIEPSSVIAPAAPVLEFPGYALNQKRLLERFAEEWKSVDAMLH